MIGNQTEQTLSTEEQRWLRARLRGQITGLLAEGSPAAGEVIQQELEGLLAELLARREHGTPQAQPAPQGWAHERDPRKRVVVTGLGVITSCGQSVPEYWDNLVHGRSGVSLIENFNAAIYPTLFAAEIKNWDPTKWINWRDVKRMSRATQFVVSAARQAMDDSGFPVPEGGTDQLGVLIGSGTTAMPETEAEVKVLMTKGGRKVSPFWVPMSLPNMPAGQLGIQFGALGWNAAITSACAASTTAIGEGAEIIRRGQVTAMLVGGTEAPLCELGLAAFSSLRALSTRNEDPVTACRPWDKTRDGMVGGEGAGMLVIEQLDHALARGAHIYAEVIGGGGSCDAYHIVAPDPSGRGGAVAIQRALESAGIAPEEVDYINAHGTGTDLNDPMETRAIKTAFGDAAYQVAISSTKSMVGHLLAGCGAVEGVATVMALQEGIIPPTINLHTPDPECDLDYTPNEARRADLRIAMSENFGFGGQNSAVIFRRWDGE